MPTTQRQLHPEVLYSGAVKTLTPRSVRTCVGAFRLGRIMDTKKGQTLMQINLAAEWRSLHAVFVGDSSLANEARTLVAFVEKGLQIPTATAFDRVLDYVKSYAAQRDAGTPRVDMTFSQEELAIQQLLGAVARESDGSADLKRELEELRAAYLAAVAKRNAAAAAARAATAEAQRGGGRRRRGHPRGAEDRRSGDDSRRGGRGRDQHRPAADAADAAREAAAEVYNDDAQQDDDGLEEYWENVQAPGTRSSSSSYAAYTELQPPDQRLIDVPGVRTPVPEPSEAAMDPELAQVFREHVARGSLRNDDAELLDAVLPKAAKVALGMHLPDAVHRARAARAAPALAALRAAAPAPAATAAATTAAAAVAKKAAAAASGAGASLLRGAAARARRGGGERACDRGKRKQSNNKIRVGREIRVSRGRSDSVAALRCSCAAAGQHRARSGRADAQLRAKGAVLQWCRRPAAPRPAGRRPGHHRPAPSPPTSMASDAAPDVDLFDAVAGPKPVRPQRRHGRPATRTGWC